MKCPCGSGQPYAVCCQPLHDGGYAQNALWLMRSRYSAYACQRADYIMRTTHPTNPQYKTDVQLWEQELLHFSKNTAFQRLEIIEFTDGEREAYVSFIAHLEQNNKPYQLKERSRFLKEGKQWLYVDGIFF